MVADMIRQRKREKGLDHFGLAMKMGGNRDEDYVVDLLEGRVRPTTQDLDVFENELDPPRDVLDFAFFGRF